jgi:hypothetical protein
VRLVSPHPFAKGTRCVRPFQFIVLVAVSVDFSVGLRVRGAAAHSCNCFSPPFLLCDCRCSFNVVYVPWRVRGAVTCGISNAWDHLTPGMETLLLATVALDDGGIWDLSRLKMARVVCVCCIFVYARGPLCKTVMYYA